MTESIQVYFKPVSGAFGLGYHESIVYTNSAGQQFYASAYATNPSGNGGGFSQQIGDVISAAGSVNGSGASPYGTLANESNPLGSGVGVTNDGAGNTYANDTVATGANLSSQFQCVVATENGITAENLKYSPLTQNSNSEANTALQACGIAKPTDTGMLSGHWAPAADKVLPTVTTTPTDDESISVTASTLTDHEAINDDGESLYESQSFDEAMYDYNGDYAYDYGDYYYPYS